MHHIKALALGSFILSILLLPVGFVCCFWLVEVIVLAIMFLFVSYLIGVMVLWRLEI